jgi:hypothetical protein
MKPTPYRCWGLRLLAGLWWLAALHAQAQHFDVELRTDRGPVAGSRIVTDFYGDLDLAGQLPVDGLTGYRMFPAYFSDFAGGRFATANPGFQAFAGTFLQGEEIYFRALGKLQYWSPVDGKWTLAPAGVGLVLFGQIPTEVVIGFATDPGTWASQYAYYQAGTRFDQAGISGPLTAAVDDVKVGGAFHSHLDWKITALSGSPPVGAYMVTLELWSSALVSGQPKYLASSPFQVVFERGINQTQMQAAFAARITPPVPQPCAAAIQAWQSGTFACTANLPATASGLSVNVADLTAPAIGTAVFQCVEGVWQTPSPSSCSGTAATRTGATAAPWAPPVILPWEQTVP